jgi:nitric oxide synthase oxygenase domain/subunit
MTKSEFQLAIDKIMDKHEANIDAKFQVFEDRMDRQFLKIDGRYNWMIGLIITATVTLGAGLGSVLFKIITMLPTITH